LELTQLSYKSAQLANNTKINIKNEMTDTTASVYEREDQDKWQAQ
jgi:hypothetical protein